MAVLRNNIYLYIYRLNVARYYNDEDNYYSEEIISASQHHLSGLG